MIFERLINRLLPTGRAWRKVPEKVISDFWGGLADALEEVRTMFLKVRDSIFPELMEVEFIADWEKRFKLPAITATEQERRDRLDTQWQNLGGQTRLYLETRLQESGFDVYVHEGVYIAEGSILGDMILGDIVLEGNTFTGEQLAINPCDQFATNVNTIGDIILGDNELLGINRPKVIINYIDETKENDSFCPLPVSRHKFVNYIGGPAGVGDIATIPAARYSEFRELVLRYKPARTWAFAFLNLD